MSQSRIEGFYTTQQLHIYTHLYMASKPLWCDVYISKPAWFNGKFISPAAALWIDHLAKRGSKPRVRCSYLNWDPNNHCWTMDQHGSTIVLMGGVGACSLVSATFSWSDLWPRAKDHNAPGLRVNCQRPSADGRTPRRSKTGVVSDKGLVQHHGTLRPGQWCSRWTMINIG